ncbi:LuxR C-terminal-related transcriptional regulator [Longispora urticae]
MTVRLLSQLGATGSRLPGGADTRWADPGGADTRRADPGGADVRRAGPGDADARRAGPGGADARTAETGRAGARRADLEGAGAREADLGGAGAGQVDLGGAGAPQAGLGGAASPPRPFLVRAPNPEPAEPLTIRELDVVRLVANGGTNAEIAADLFLSPGTVKNHIASVQRKLGVANRVGIAAWAWAGGHATL